MLAEQGMSESLSLAPTASTVPWAPCMAKHPKLGAPRVLLVGCRGGSPGVPWVLSAGGTPEGAPATSWEEQRDSHCLGLPRDGAVPVVQAARGVELSSVVQAPNSQTCQHSLPHRTLTCSSPDRTLSPVGWPGTGSRQEAGEVMDLCLCSTRSSRAMSSNQGNPVVPG